MCGLRSLRHTKTPCGDTVFTSSNNCFVRLYTSSFFTTSSRKNLTPNNVCIGELLRSFSTFNSLSKPFPTFFFALRNLSLFFNHNLPIKDSILSSSKRFNALQYNLKILSSLYCISHASAH